MEADVGTDVGSAVPGMTGVHFIINIVGVNTQNPHNVMPNIGRMDRMPPTTSITRSDTYIPDNTV